MLDKYGINTLLFFVHCDNKSAINISKNHVQHSRTRHVDIRHHFVRGLVEEKLTIIEHVPSEK